jgi:DNA-binding transcriptional LysR family regulator
VDLDWLETFLAVVDRGGFTAASQWLHRPQSRVSGHVAALERDLGVQLFDRSRRPAALTPAGEVFVRHARQIVAEIATARSAVGALGDLGRHTLTLVTTPCIGTALFPGVVARLSAEVRGVRIDLAEQSWHDVERRFVAEGSAMAVLPVVAPPLTQGLQRQLLWRERLLAVVPRGHELARSGGAVPLNRLSSCSLVVCRASADGQSEALAALAAGGFSGQPHVTVDTPQTLVSLVRAGAGVGVLNAVALQARDLTGLAVVRIDDDAVREVAAYWSDVLLRTDTGRRLHRAVLEAPLPAGAEPIARPAGLPAPGRRERLAGPAAG